VVSRPLAGTRRHGKSDEEDKLMERELLGDEKECAEHVMLVDLGWNDLGKVKILQCFSICPNLVHLHQCSSCRTICSITSDFMRAGTAMSLVNLMDIYDNMRSTDEKE
jgi:anthranilate/para-aminobenzoate synthase component I